MKMNQNHHELKNARNHFVWHVCCFKNENWLHELLKAIHVTSKKILPLPMFVRIQFIVALGMMSLLTSCASAKTIIAASASYADVASAIAISSDGDTVNVPAGKATWTSTLYLTNGASLIGAGIGQTVITDEVPRSGSSYNVIQASVYSHDFVRISGISFAGGVTNTSDNWNGLVELASQVGALFRFDHCSFTNGHGINLYVTGAPVGVVDHCFFNSPGKEDIQTYAGGWAGQSFADGSWDTPAPLGTANALYIESNVFMNGGVVPCVDSYTGSRLVFRYNAVTNSYIGNHGTETTARYRGCRSFEIYGNTFDWPVGAPNSPWPFWCYLRSGTGVIYSNTAIGQYSGSIVAAVYRINSACTPWGLANGTNVWDSNSGTIYASGTCTGTNNSTFMVDANASWTVNQWAGYSLNDANSGGNLAAMIYSNTSNTIYVQGTGGNCGSNMKFFNGDPYQILLVQAVLDQPGRGSGDTLSSYSPAINVSRGGIPAWPTEPLDPIYQWSNTLNDAPVFIGSTQSPLLQANRDWYDNTQKPGYAPLAFPNPLTTVTTNALTAPLGLRVIGSP